MPGETNVRTADAPTDEIFEVVLPEGVELAPGEAAEEKPEPEVKAEEEVVEEPEVKVTRAKGNRKPAAEKKPDEKLHPAVREERDKRKKYAKLWEETEAERERLEAELRGRRAAPAATGMSKEYVAAIKERANKAETMGDLMEIALEEIGKRDTQWSNALQEERFNRHLHVSEALARRDLPGYDKVLREAGITDAVKIGADGQFADPIIARMIYTAPNPAAKAYEMAAGKLEKAGRLDEVLGANEAETPEEEVELPGKKPAAKDAAGERRAGAREVIDRVSAASSKPRGLQAVQPAGPPKRGLTRGDLDRMSEENPEAMRALFKANPKLETWWLGGVESA